MTQPNVLSDSHRASLETESAIRRDLIEERGYQTVTTKAALKDLGFSPIQQLVPALLIPDF